MTKFAKTYSPGDRTPIPFDVAEDIIAAESYRLALMLSQRPGGISVIRIGQVLRNLVIEERQYWEEMDKIP